MRLAVSDAAIVVRLQKVTLWHDGQEWVCLGPRRNGQQVLSKEQNKTDGPHKFTRKRQDGGNPLGQKIHRVG
jgi:hypothetical protein